MKAEDSIANFVSFTKFSRPRDPFDVIPTAERAYITRNDDKLPRFKIRQNHLKKLFLPWTVIEWSKLGLNSRNSKFH